VAQPKASVCTEEMTRMYEAALGTGTEKLRAHVDSIVARRGKPTWGDCL